jgi:hypothetical protein
MADNDILSFEMILTALREEAADCFTDPVLVTIDFSKIADVAPKGGEAKVQRLKASRRVAFLKAELYQEDALIFSAKAVFKARAGLE